MSLIWGKETKLGTWDHLDPGDYDDADFDFQNEGFTLEDLRLFTAFSNMKGGDKNGQILRYIWMRIFKQVFERRLKGKYHNTVFTLFSEISKHDLNQAITSADLTKF